MNIVLISDCHATSRVPRNRIGNPLTDFKAKMKFVFETARKHEAIILQAGDLFDSPRDITALYAFLEVVEEFMDIDFYTIYGQHDLYFRNKDVLTNLNLLKKAGIIKILNNHPRSIEDVQIYGCSWGDEIPISKSNAFEILVIHAPIYKKQLFPGHEIIKPERLQTERPFDLILCGDIHRRFITRNEKIGMVVNTGPMMRLEATEYSRKHKPQLFLFDTESQKNEAIIIPHKPFEEVLRNNSFKEEKETLIDFNIDLKDIDVDKINILRVIDKLIRLSKNRKGIEKTLHAITKLKVLHKQEMRDNR